MGVMELVYAWMVGFMVAVAPPGRTTFYAEAQESREVALARYDSIAKDIVEVVFDPQTKPLFTGDQGRVRTATVVLSIMLHEGGFMRNADFGIGKFGRGDGGKSWCLMQINVGKGRTMSWNTKYDRLPRFGDDPKDIVPGLTGPELVADRKNCIREGLKVLRLSFGACPGLPLEQKLRVYGSGNCNGAVEGSAIRMRSAIKLWETTKKERLFVDSDQKERAFTDKDVQEALLYLKRKQDETPRSEPPQSDKVAEK